MVYTFRPKDSDSASPGSNPGPPAIQMPAFLRFLRMRQAGQMGTNSGHRTHKSRHNLFLACSALLLALASPASAQVVPIDGDTIKLPETAGTPSCHRQRRDGHVETRHPCEDDEMMLVPACGPLLDAVGKVGIAHAVNLHRERSGNKSSPRHVHLPLEAGYGFATGNPMAEPIICFSSRSWTSVRSPCRRKSSLSSSKPFSTRWT